jgi:mRNA interferase MazF
MINLKQKDIVLLPYPYSNLKEEKVRPALVLSNESFNSQSHDCIVVPLTSVIKDDLYSVLISQSDMSEGTLIRPSRIRPDKIFNVEKKLVKMRVGSVKHAVFDKVRQEVVKIMN